MPATWPSPDIYLDWLETIIADWRSCAMRYRSGGPENLIEVPDPAASAARLEHLADQLEVIARDSCVGVLVTMQRGPEGRLLDPRVAMQGRGGRRLPKLPPA